MKKTFKVVMLATEKAIWPNCIWLGRISNQLRLDKSYNNSPKSIEPIDDSMLPQHLYIISDDEIKEGDWFIEFLNRKPLNVRHLDVTPVKGTILKDDKKIIATTDESLKLYHSETLASASGFQLKTNDIHLPQLPESFIKAYIKAYNEGKPITEVDLEMNDDGFCERLRTGECKTACDNGFCKESSIKTRPDNTVIVKESKKYSLDEVMTYAFYASQYTSKQIAKNPKVVITKSEIEEYIRREVD